MRERRLRINDTYYTIKFAVHNASITAFKVEIVEGDIVRNRTVHFKSHDELENALQDVQYQINELIGKEYKRTDPTLRSEDIWRNVGGSDVPAIDSEKIFLRLIGEIVDASEYVEYSQ